MTFVAFQLFTLPLISTHTLCEEGDHKGDFDADTWHGFLPTPSARRVTSGTQGHPGRYGISTHTLCEEGDGWMVEDTSNIDHFYPHPLRGG